jgi:hypothetical protein
MFAVLRGDVCAGWTIVDSRSYLWKLRVMALTDRVGEFLQRMTPMMRGNLLAELERLELCEDEMPGSAEILARLRAELRKDGSTQHRAGNPSRYFFAPLEPLLTDGAPPHANSGRIARGSLSSIWGWISHDLLPTMARDYVKQLDGLNAADNQREARKVVAAFQTKVVKYLESTLGSPDRADETRAKLAVYTASHAVYEDLTRMLCVLRAREALAKFTDALPASIERFDGARVSKIAALLDGFAKDHAEAIPFALALVARRLKTPWQLVRVATKAAPSKNAADVAATPYAIAVSMVLDRLDDSRSALRVALRNERVLVAKEILTNIYDTEYALRVRIDLLDQSDWGKRLSRLMDAIAALVDDELARFPDKLGHVLGSRGLRSYQSLAGRLTYIAWKGRDAASDAAGYCRKLIGQSGNSRA